MHNGYAKNGRFFHFFFFFNIIEFEAFKKSITEMFLLTKNTVSIRQNSHLKETKNKTEEKEFRYVLIRTSNT